MIRRTLLPTLLAIAGLLRPAAPLSGQAPDRSAPPAVGPAGALSLPPIERFTLGNGVRVVFMEKGAVPLVELRLIFTAGSVDDPPEQVGLASMAADMLDEGAGGKDAFELADAIDFLGASLSTSAGLHTTTVSLQSPLSRLGEALPLFADVVLRPNFSPGDLERLRGERLTGMIQAFDEPSSIGSAQFMQALYGSRHPYGRRETPASIRSLTVEDLATFHARMFRPERATLVAVGATTVAALRPALESALGSWKAAEPTGPVTVEPSKQVEGRTVFLVDKPGSAQSVVYVGRIGASRDTPDYSSLLVTNTVLGGSYTSRLNQNLREDKGYTYGAGSTFNFLPVPGPFLAFASIQSEFTAAALQEFLGEIRGMSVRVPDEELERAKSYVALQYPKRFETVEQIARQLADLVVYGLPDDTFNTFTDRILAVAWTDVQSAAQDYLDPESLVFVVVGDRATIETQIRESGVGEVNVLSVRDVLGDMPKLESDSP